MAHIFWELPSGSFAVIEYDAVTSENHNTDAAITDHPVEVGANITDHVRTEPTRVSQEIIITNTPVNEGTVTDMVQVGLILLTKTQVQLETKGRARVGSATVSRGFVQPFRGPGLPRIHDTPRATASDTMDVSTGTSISVLEGFSTADRVRAVYEALIELQASGQPLTLVTDLKEYEDVLIKSIGVPRTASASIRVQLEFKKVRFVSTQSTEVTRKKPKEKRAADAAVAAVPTASYADANDEERGSSIARRDILMPLARTAVDNAI